MQPVPPPRFDELQSVIFHLEKKILVQSISSHFCFGAQLFLENEVHQKEQVKQDGQKEKHVNTYISYLKEQVKQDGGKVKQVQQIKHKHSVLYKSNSW